MELLSCKSCGGLSMMPVELDTQEGSEKYLEEEGLLDAFQTEKESNFFTCHVCGDNWITVKKQSIEGCEILFIHQMGIEPLLRRIAHMQTHIVLNEGAVDFWEYYLGEDTITEDKWMDYLAKRRRILKSICCN